MTIINPRTLYRMIEIAEMPRVLSEEKAKENDADLEKRLKRVDVDARLTAVLKVGFAIKPAFVFRLKEREELNEAVSAYKKEIKSDPNNVAAQYILGCAFYHLGENDDAKSCYKTVIKLDPNNAAAHNNLGVILYIGYLIDAIMLRGEVEPNHSRNYRKVVRFNSDDITHYNLGSGKQGELDEAVLCYKKAVELDPKLAVAHYNLGLALENKKKPGEAMIHYQFAAQLGDKNAETKLAELKQKQAGGK